MAWTDIPDTDIDTNSPLDTDLFTELRDNIRECARSVVNYEYAEQSTTSATFVTLVSREIFIPDVDGPIGQANLIAEVRVSTDTGSFRLRDNASTNVGATVTTTSATYEDKTLSITIDASWQGTLRTIEVQGHRGTGGTAFTQVVNRIAFEIEY